MNGVVCPAPRPARLPTGCGGIGSRLIQNFPPGFDRWIFQMGVQASSDLRDVLPLRSSGWRGEGRGAVRPDSPQNSNFPSAIIS